MACCAIGCKNRFADKGDVHFYRIPKPKTPFDENRRELWVQAIKRIDWNEKTISNSRICSAHFITGTFSLDPNHPDFVPSVFSFTKPRDIQKGLKKLERFNRRIKRTEAKGVPYVPDTPEYSPEQMAAFAQNTSFNWPSIKTSASSSSKKLVGGSVASITKVVEQIHGLKKGDIIPFEFKPDQRPPVTRDEQSDDDLPEVCLQEGCLHQDHSYATQQHRPMVGDKNPTQTSVKPIRPPETEKHGKKITKRDKKLDKDETLDKNIKQRPEKHNMKTQKDEKLYKKIEKDEKIDEKLTQREEKKQIIPEEKPKPDHSYAAPLHKPVKKVVVCYICNGKFFGATQFRIHMRIHLGEKQHICSVCDKRFTTKPLLRRHTMMHTNEKPYSCSVCGQKFKSTKTLNVHLTKHLGKQFECDKCGKKYGDRQSFRAHVKGQHEDKPYRCPVCKKSFETLEIAEKHLEIHVKEQELRALTGEANTKDFSNLTISYIGSEPDEYLCFECGKIFAKKRNLSIHMRIHKGDKLFTCSVCGSNHSSKSHLHRHMMLHREFKPYRCQICPKAFRLYFSLRLHTISHTGDKPFLCEVCGKRFSLRTQLKVHERTHTGEKPFACSVCSKRFRDLNGLKKHVRTHTKRTYSCSDCKRRFKYMLSLKKHMKRHETQSENKTGAGSEPKNLQETGQNKKTVVHC